MIVENFIKTCNLINISCYSAYVMRDHDDGKAKPAQISMAKKNNVAMARLCARTARELLGANGISLEYSPIRHMANIESVYTYEGTDDIHTLIIGNDITGIAAFGTGN